MAADRIVIDTSIVLKWFHPEENTPAALEILSSIEKREVVSFAPDLLIFEVVNAWIRGMGNDDSEIPALLSALYLLPIVIVSPEPHLMVNAAKIAITNKNLSVYDATFASLAIQEDAILHTADKKFHDILIKAGLQKYTNLLN